MWWEGSDYKDIIQCERQRGGNEIQIGQNQRGLLGRAGDESPLNWFTCPKRSAFWTVLKWYAMKVTAMAYGSGHGRFNCLSPCFPVFCWSMKIKTTRLLWQECGTNQCQKNWRSSARCLDLDVWMAFGMYQVFFFFFYHLLIFSMFHAPLLFPCTWVFDCECPKHIELHWM